MSIEKQSLSTLTTMFIILIFTVISAYIVVAVIGPFGKGASTLAVLIPGTMVNFGNFGIGMANVYYIGKKEKLKDVLSNSVFFAIMVSAFLVALAFALYPFLRFSVFKSLSTVALYTAILTVPALLLQAYWSTIVLGMKKINLYNISLISRSATYFIFLLIFLPILRLGYYGVLIAFLVSYIVLDLIYFLYFRKQLGLRIFAKPDLRLAKMQLTYGLKSFFSSVFDLMNVRIDVFIVSYFLTRRLGAYAATVQVGLYAFAANIAEILWYLANSVKIVLFPTVASADAEEAKRVTPIVCRNVIFLTLIAAALLLFSVKILITLILPKFIPSVRVIYILLPAIVIFTVPKVLGADILGRGRPEISAITNFLAVSINIILNVILIPKYGIAGAALASVFSYGCSAVFITISYVILSGNSAFDTLIIKPSDRFYYYRLIKSIYLSLSARISGARA